MIHPKILIFILLGMCPMLANAQEPTVKLGVNTNDVLIGDKIEFVAELKFASDKYNMILPNLGESYFTPFKISGPSQNDTLQQGNITTITQHTTIQGYDSGIFVLPSIYANGFNLDSNSSKTTISDSIKIKVNYVPVNLQQDIKDIRLQETDTYKQYLPYAIGIGILLLCIPLVYFLYKYWKNKSNKIIKISPYQQAKNIIEATKKAQYYDKHQSKIHYSNITDAIRGYIQDAYKIDILDKTTNDTIDIISQNHLIGIYANQIKEIFEEADLVKFAKVIPATAQHKLQLEKANDLIDQMENKLLQFQEQLKKQAENDRK